MVTDGNQTYHDDHFERYRNIESLRGVTVTKIVAQYYYTSKTNKQTQLQKKRSDLWLPESGDTGKGNWMKGVKMYQLEVSYKINQYYLCNAMYNMINMINTALCYI